MITKEQREDLIAAAIEVRKNSYSPYSNYKVGAALLSGSGNIYVGSNFENGSFGAGICVERVALGAALSAGERKFIAFVFVVVITKLHLVEFVGSHYVSLVIWRLFVVMKMEKFLNISCLKCCLNRLMVDS